MHLEVRCHDFVLLCYHTLESIAVSQMFYSYNEAKICLRKYLYLNIFKMLPDILQYLVRISFFFATIYLLIVYVLLTVHLSIVSDNDQLDKQLLFFKVRLL